MNYSTVLLRTEPFRRNTISYSLIAVVVNDERENIVLPMRTKVVGRSRRTNALGEVGRDRHSLDAEKGYRRRARPRRR